jgi:hypothetical protein
MPFQLALVGAALRAHRHPDVMIDQVAQHLANGAKPIEQVEYQPDRRLRLFVGLQDDFPRRTPQISHRYRLAEFAATGLRSPPL